MTSNYSELKTTTLVIAYNIKKEFSKYSLENIIDFNAILDKQINNTFHYNIGIRKENKEVNLFTVFIMRNDGINVKIPLKHIIVTELTKKKKKKLNKTFSKLFSKEFRNMIYRSNPKDKSEGIKPEEDKAEEDKLEGVKVGKDKVEGIKPEGVKVEGVKVEGVKVEGVKVEGDNELKDVVIINNSTIVICDKYSICNNYRLYLNKKNNKHVDIMIEKILKMIFKYFKKKNNHGNGTCFNSCIDIIIGETKLKYFPTTCIIQLTLGNNSIPTDADKITSIWLKYLNNIAGKYKGIVLDNFKRKINLINKRCVLNDIFQHNIYEMDELFTNIEEEEEKLNLESDILDELIEDPEDMVFSKGDTSNKFTIVFNPDDKDEKTTVTIYQRGSVLINSKTNVNAGNAIKFLNELVGTYKKLLQKKSIK